MQGITATAATTLADYRIGRVLGRGATATVYEGLRPALDVPVAIKVLHPHLWADSTATARFLREGRAIARIRHPNVVHVIESGQQDGLLFLVMECLEGDDLRCHLRRAGPLPVVDVAELILPVIAGVTAAHVAGVVHRDLKPGNIRLARDASGGIVPKVLDFGLSKWRDGAGEHSLTHSESLAGTTSYMSPEQLLSPKDVDERSDVYALGVILYECCTGRRPFTGETVYDLMTAVLTMPPVPPSALRSDIPAAFDEVVLGAMARDPAARLESAAALGRALAPMARDAARWAKAFASEAAAPPRETWEARPPAVAPAPGRSFGAFGGPCKVAPGGTMAARKAPVTTGSGPGAESAHRVARAGVEGGFDVSVDDGARLVRAILRGVWDVTMAEEFGAALDGAAGRLGAAPWCVLCDSRDFQVQSPEVTQIRQKVMANIRTRGCLKIALIAASAVYKMQFHRIAVESRMGSSVFSDENAALAWLQGGAGPDSE